MNEIRNTVARLIGELHPEIDPEKETHLTDGILDSFDIVTLITSLKDTLQVTVTADRIIPENFDSLDAICALIETLDRES